MYLLFKEAKLLQSREELWEIRKHEILALPDPLASLSAEQRQGFDWMRGELETVFKKDIKQGQIVFRAMPIGNEHVLRGFVTHFVIDNIVCSQEEVHKRLASLLGSDYECQEPCQCPRRLLSNSMTEALCRQNAGPSKERILHNVMAEYMLVSRPQINLPNSTSIANTPVVSRPNSLNGSTALAVGLSDTTTIMSSGSHEGSSGSNICGSCVRHEFGCSQHFRRCGK